MEIVIILSNLARFDKIITISMDEHFVFSSFLGNKVYHLPPCFPEKFSLSSSVAEKKYDLLFIGSDNPFNVEALDWFQRYVNPLLPLTVTTCVVGRVCRTAVQQENVHLIPHVQYLDDVYSNARIAICPMLHGTGIKIKVVEALSYGMPVVGTEKALDGFSEKQQNGCLVTDDPQQFAYFVKQLLSDGSLFEKKQAEAKKYFSTNFSENNSIRIWHKILKQGN